MPDPVFEDIFRDTERLRWASTGEVRQRGRRLARQRTTTVLVSVLVLVAGGGAGAFNALAGAGPPNGPEVVATPPTTSAATSAPTASPSSGPTTTTPSPPAGTPSAAASGGATSDSGDQSTGTTIPADAMLQVADLPSGFRAHTPEFEGDGQLNFFSSICDNDWTSPKGDSVAERQRFFRAGGADLDQRVWRYPLADARRYIGMVRANVNGCAGTDGIEISVVDQGFAGQESLLVRSGADNSWVLVQQADLVAEISLSRVADADARRLADRAADRLCAGTNAC